MIIADFSNLMYNNYFLQNNQSTVTSFASTMIQRQPSPHASMQQNQTGAGKLTQQ